MDMRPYELIQEFDNFFRLLSNSLLFLNEMTQCHLILLLSTVFASAALVSSLAGSSLKRTKQASSSVFVCCFAALEEHWVPGHVRQHMIIDFCDCAGTSERRGWRPWLVCSFAVSVCIFFRWQSFPTLIKGGTLAIFFCCLQVVCVVALASWGAIV